MGAAPILFPSHPGRGVSPTHPDHDRSGRCSRSGASPSSSTSVAAVGPSSRRSTTTAGRSTDFLGGGENVRAKDYMVIHQQPEQFFSAMVLDGVLEAHPGLQGGCIEQGAMWVVPWLRRLDLCQATFGRPRRRCATCPSGRRTTSAASSAFTPFPGEDVGWLIEQCGDDLFLFSSDYPHPEGTKDPLSRFEATMDGVSDAGREKFYLDNFARLMGMETAAASAQG